jgi:hypothetical protein
MKDDGAFCDCVDVPLVAEPPNIYFVLDRSGSMSHQNKWKSAQNAVGQLTTGLGSRASFGVTLFPGGTQDCGPGVEVFATRLGDPPATVSTTENGPTTTALLAAIDVMPQGGTPTSATLQYALGRLKTLKGRSVVVLVTDGAPNCNDAATCTVDLCSDNIAGIMGCPRGGPPNCCLPPNGTNCIDGAASAKAAADLAAAGFPTYVIGLATSDQESTVLDELAVAGGTAGPDSPKYFLANDLTQQGLLATLRKVAGKIAGACVQKLKAAPADPNLVNVYLDEVVLPQDPVNGWKIEGDTVMLLGTSCTQVESGDVLDIRLITGCPTVKPR